MGAVCGPGLSGGEERDGKVGFGAVRGPGPS